MAKKQAAYTVVYERDEDGWWVAAIPSVQGCHTQGRTIASARKRIREALSVCLDDARTANSAILTDDIRLPDDAARLVRAAVGSKKAAEEAAASAREKTRSAIVRLKKSGMSLRDTATILHLSHQRIGAVVHARG